MCHLVDNELQQVNIGRRKGGSDKEGGSEKRREKEKNNSNTKNLHEITMTIWMYRCMYFKKQYTSTVNINVTSDMVYHLILTVNTITCTPLVNMGIPS